MKKNLFTMKHSALAILLIAALVLSVTALCACAASTVKVPDVVGMTKDEAEKAITDLSLVMKVSRERFSNTTPEGSVDKMDTEAGTELKKGDEVKVVISQGKGVTVPSMSALTGAEAQNLLVVLGFNCIVKEEFSDEVPAGNVISYTDSGRTLPVGSDVTLTVSKGPQA